MASRTIAKATSKRKPPRSPLAWKTKAISDCGKNGCADEALRLFEGMPKKNQVAWNALLAALVDAGRTDAALTSFNQMPQRNATSYATMIAGLSRAGTVAKARRIFDSVPLSWHNVFTWTSMLSCYVKNGEALEALELFARLHGEFFEIKILPNAHTFSSLLKASVAVRSLPVAMQLHAASTKLLDEGSRDCIFVRNALIDVHAKLGKLVNAERIFHRMGYKNLGSWNTMMDGYTHHMLIHKARNLFDSMQSKDTLSWNIMISGFLEDRRGEDALQMFISLARSEDNAMPNASTYTLVLNACSVLTSLGFGRQIHACIVRNGLYVSNVFVCNSLISMYASCGSTDELEQVFNEMAAKDIVSWNSAIQGLGQNGLGRRALEIAERAFESNICNGNTFVAILTCCSHAGLVVEGLRYFDSMRQTYSVEPELDHYICLIDLLGRAGRLEEAHDLLRSMPFTASTLAWSTLLHSCLAHKNSCLASIAVRELRTLEPGCAEQYERFVRTGGGSKASDDVMFKRKDLRRQPGCSWII